MDKLPPLPEHTDVGRVEEKPRELYSSTDSWPFENEPCRYDEVALRNKVLKEAETWLRTPFHHLQRCKGAGVDCGQFLLGVYHNVGIMPNITTEYYPRDFHLHRDREWYKEIVSTYATEMPPNYIPLPADIVLYRIGRVYSDGAIVVDWPRIIHSYVTMGVVYADGTGGWISGHRHVFFRPLAFNGDGEKCRP